MSEIKFLTYKLLKSWNACSEYLKIFKNGRLEGFPVEFLNELKGDHEGFVDWIKNQLNIERKYDQFGNMIWEKNLSGDIMEYGYDRNGNMIWKKYPDAYIIKYGYDEHGNCIWKKHPSGRYLEYNRYDDKGNCIWMEDSDGRIYEMKYDEHGNLIVINCPDGRNYQYKYDDFGNIIWKNGDSYIHEYEIQYYHDGQLKRLNKLEIPWFEKGKNKMNKITQIVAYKIDDKIFESIEEAEKLLKAKEFEHWYYSSVETELYDISSDHFFQYLQQNEKSIKKLMGW